jgi:hypothetical protein
MPKGSLEHQEMVRLLARLKEETPEYPADLLDARKYSFLKQIVDLKLSAEGQPGGTAGPGGAGRPGAALKAGAGGATILGLPLKAAIAIGMVILMLTAGYLFREQIVEFLAENGLINTAETAAPPLASTPEDPAHGTPAAATPPTFGPPASGGEATEAAPGPGSNGPGATPTPPARPGLEGVFQYLLCILQSGTESCR